MPFITRLLILLVASILTSGCATIGGWSQYVKVSTDADSAKVSMDGYDLGRAPGFVKMRRASSKTLVVTAEGKSKDVVVEGRYRWRDSFAANVFAALFSPYLAIGGLGLDFLTGAAWQMEKPERVVFHAGEPSKPLMPRSIAVAPPRYGDELASDEIANELYLLLRQRFQGVKIVAHDQLVAIYMSYETDNENFVSIEHRDELYRELGTTHMAFSRVEDRGSGLEITVRIVDILRDSVVDKFTATIAKREMKTKTAGWWTYARNPLVKLIPNSIGLQSAWGGYNYYRYGSMGVTDDWEVERTNALGLFNTNVSLTSSNVLNLKTKPGFAFRFRLVPLATFKNEEFDTNDDPIRPTQNSQKWKLLQLGFGIGPEIGIETALGYVYLNYVPQITNYWIRGPMDYGMWKFAQSFELGYSFFIAERINSRLAVRQHVYPRDVMDPMIRYVSPNADLEGASFVDGTVTFSIEYVFPEIRKRVTKIIE